MLVHRQKLERRQAFLFRAVDIANEIFAIAASVARVRSMLASDDKNAETAVELADAFSVGARRRMERAFYALWNNDDVAQYRFAQRVLDGRYAWNERVVGANDLPLPGPAVIAPAAPPPAVEGPPHRRSA
jgi:hypothetical protein